MDDVDGTDDDDDDSNDDDWDDSDDDWDDASMLSNPLLLPSSALGRLSILLDFHYHLWKIFFVSTNIKYKISLSFDKYKI